MHSWAEKLRKLQAVQIRLAKMQEELNGMPGEKAHVQDRYAKETASVQEALDTLKSQELSLRGLDGQIESIRVKKRDFQAKSALIKSNDEYRAAMLQIEMCDKAISDLEDQQLEIMETMDAQRKVIEERRAVLKEAEAKAAVVTKRLDARIGELEESMKSLKATLPALEEGIEPEFLAEYHRLRKSKVIPQTMPVLVPVSGDSCGGCRMQVTEQVKHQAMNGHLVCCPSCHSILYWDD